MNHGCHGALVETQATSSISHWVHTGLVVSGVEATSIRSSLSRTISCLATSGARLGLDWLSRSVTWTGRVALPILRPPLIGSRDCPSTKLSASGEAARGPAGGLA